MTPGHVGSAAEKSLGIIVLRAALRGIRKKRAVVIKLSLLWAPIAFCFHALIYSLIHLFSYSCHTCFGSGLSLDDRNKEKRQMDPALWEHLKCVLG